MSYSLPSIFRTIVWIFIVAFSSGIQAAEPIAIGTRLEPFVDDALIDSMDGTVELKLHSPVAREVAMIFDESWEGGSSGYSTVIKDGGVYSFQFKDVSESH